MKLSKVILAGRRTCFLSSAGTLPARKPNRVWFGAKVQVWPSSPERTWVARGSNWGQASLGLWSAARLSSDRLLHPLRSRMLFSHRLPAFNNPEMEGLCKLASTLGARLTLQLIKSPSPKNKLIALIKGALNTPGGHKPMDTSKQMLSSHRQQNPGSH